MCEDTLLGNKVEQGNFLKTFDWKIDSVQGNKNALFVFT